MIELTNEVAAARPIFHSVRQVQFSVSYNVAHEDDNTCSSGASANKCEGRKRDRFLGCSTTARHAAAGLPSAPGAQRNAALNFVENATIEGVTCLA
jgi:hypothetical protein